MDKFSYKTTKVCKQSGARIGEFTTPHGVIETPVFEASELFHRGVGETTDIVTGSVDAKTLQAVYNGALKRCQ